MLQALRDLKTAKEEGLLSDEQYEKQHAALLAGEQRWGTSPTPDRLAAMESQLDRLTERLLPPDKTSRVKTVKTAPAKYKTADGLIVQVIGKTIYHRYEEGWYPGKVLRQITLSTITSRNGKFAIKFEDSASEIDHPLKPHDYGGNGHWLLVK